MADLAIFILTDDQLRQVRQWERDKDMLEREIAERQRKLSAINDRLQAVAKLGVEVPRSEPPAHANGKDETEDEADGRSLTEAIERIAKAALAPLSKKDLKTKLLAEKFAEDRLGPYFYTVVMRLKQKGRIRVMDDGSVWRPQTNEAPAGRPEGAS
jgi:hypothetical protein